MKRLNPLNDYLFQKYLGEKGDEEQLLSFLNAVLKRTDKLKTIEILENKKLTADTAGDKTIILDVRAITEDETRINIEVQVKNTGPMDRRSLFYWSREFSKGITSGDDYHQLPDVITINIINYEFLPIDAFHTTFHLWEDNNKDIKLTEALEIHFIDMVKFRRLKGKDINGDSLHRWLTFFDKNTSEEVLKEVITMEAAIQKAHEKMTFLSNDPDTLRIYEQREMGRLDYTSGINHAKREGIREGEIKGKREAMLEIARNLLKLNTPIGVVSKSTGLDEAAIKELQRNLQ